MTENRSPYPVRVDAALDAPLSRGLWLVKWLLIVPHIVVLVFLWVAFTVLSVVAFFAILFTGRYPRPLFDFNLGVLRWTWRVQYYAYGALGTDRYPPFTLADVPDYPARLDVPYPEKLSRGLVLVKWWLLAIPHYLVLAVFVGGGIWLGTGGWDDDGAWDSSWGAGGLVGLLVLVAAIVLLFTGRYPRSIYDFVLGMDRWSLRVAAYVGLMTDAYPPFRLDMGGTDPGSVPAGPTAPPPLAPTVAAPAGPVGAGSPPASRWSTGRIVTVVIGAVLLFLSTGLLAAGGGLLWADQTQRDADGYLWSPDAELSTDRYALTSDGFALDTQGAEWVIDDFLGTAQLEVTPLDGGTEVFVGIAPTRDVNAYLGDVGHHEIGDLGPRWDNRRFGPGMMRGFSGGAPDVPPTEIDIWVAEASGTGTQVLDWRPQDGNWTIVVMRADGSAGVDVEARAGATVPGLTWISVGLLVTGGVLALVGAVLVAVAVHRAQHGPPAPGTPAEHLPPPGPQGTGAPDPVLVTGPAPER
ncbi:hypothetical protein GCM10010531_12650 [Blastococcus jejuensis]|uniref:DUF4389 domain-containing protein n=1 Tax=Blastococcus jejuensis TaxID=351224 RepID=A0ABP6NYQ9_9ACTN